MLTTEAIVVPCGSPQCVAARLGGCRATVGNRRANPHAGEDGAIGEEEITIIAPAIEELRYAGIDVCGPLPPDSMFTRSAREGYDVAIGMYHDQP